MAVIAVIPRIRETYREHRGVTAPWRKILTRSGDGDDDDDEVYKRVNPVAQSRLQNKK